MTTKYQQNQTCKLSLEDKLELAYNQDMCYHDIEKQSRRNKRKRKGYKCN